jgi:hypothetical protein
MVRTFWYTQPTNERVAPREFTSGAVATWIGGDKVQDTSETAGTKPLYEALIAYEDATGSVQVQQLTVMSAYRTLTDAIGGHGDLQEAQARFALEFPILGVMHEDWKRAALTVSAAVADGLAWQESFVIPRKRCVQCGAAWSPKDPWDHATGCNSCFADANPSNADLDARDHWATPGVLSERPWRPE